MPETLASDATIHLFGRVVTDLALVNAPPPTPGPVAATLGNANSLPAKKGAPSGAIARIYAFAFQNEYVELASPALFVLYVQGNPVAPTLDLAGVSRIPDNLNPDLTVWTVERDDTTVRLDVTAGTFARVLLDYELADTGLQDFVRGGGTLGTPTAVSSRSRRRPRGWRSDDE